MHRFIDGEDRMQQALLPHSLEDYVDGENPVRGASIARYLRALDQADREESDNAEAKSGRLKEKIAGLRRQMRALKTMEQTVQGTPDQQVSLTDPDARSMATSGKGTATVGYKADSSARRNTLYRGCDVH